MRKIFLFVLMAILLLSSACSSSQEDAQPQTNSDAIQNQKETNDLQQETVSIEAMKSGTYTNAELGFCLTFPESWNDWYTVDMPEDEVVRIKFVGKSKAGTTLTEDAYGGGLPMFYIISEKALANNVPWDSVKAIGTVDDVEFYFATSTGAEIGVLRSVIEKNEETEEEIELTKKDLEKADEMFAEIEGILKTFSAN